MYIYILYIYKIALSAPKHCSTSCTKTLLTNNIFHLKTILYIEFIYRNAADTVLRICVYIYYIYIHNI